jgi:dienelactone hydrolase
VPCAACIQLDPFLFEGEPAESIDEDYHGLPLASGFVPEWVDEKLVEREIFLRSPSGEVLAGRSGDNFIHGAFLRAPVSCPPAECPLSGTGVTFVYQHGNSGDLFFYWHRAVSLWSTGANVFIYSYRGYGLSRGKSTRAHILEDADTALRWVRSRTDVNPKRIFAYGYSMGGIPTSWLAGVSPGRTSLRGVILEAALDSPASTANLSTGTAWPEGFFLDADTPFDGPVFMKGADLPVLHMHGGDDDRVLRRQAQNYCDVLSSRSDYTAIIGLSAHPAEAWMQHANHRNLTQHAFVAPLHISEYFDNPDNPGRCCIHPQEWKLPANSAFLSSLGMPEGEIIRQSSRDYLTLVSDWVLATLSSHH